MHPLRTLNLVCVEVLVHMLLVVDEWLAEAGNGRLDDLAVVVGAASRLHAIVERLEILERAVVEVFGQRGAAANRKASQSGSSDH